MSGLCQNSCDHIKHFMNYIALSLYEKDKGKETLITIMGQSLRLSYLVS